jgi:hypothetical protein
MRHALPLFPANHAAPRGGFKTRIRSWLALVMPARRIAAKEVGACATMAPAEPRANAVLLSFPIRGEALLVKLAAELRKRVADYGPQRDPFLLTIARCPGARLAIDRHACVEFITGQSTYRVIVSIAEGTRFTLETADFDTLVKFVAQYVTDRLSEPMVWEAAS